MKDLRLEPKRAWVTSGGQVAVTVRGRGIGFVTCAAERRFVWGRFVTCFLVDARKNASVTVSARGPFGGQSWSVKLAPTADVTPQQVPRIGAAHAPRVRPVKFRAPRSPRLKAS